MDKFSNSSSYEYLFKTVLHNELTTMVKQLSNQRFRSHAKKYLTIKEVSSITGIDTYTLRQLTYARAMPHRKVQSRIIFEENEIKETVDNFNKFGWTDPDNDWDVEVVQSEIEFLLTERKKLL